MLEIALVFVIIVATPIFAVALGLYVQFRVWRSYPVTLWTLECRYQDCEVEVGARGLGGGSYVVFVDRYGRSLTVMYEEATKDKQTFRML